MMEDLIVVDFQEGEFMVTCRTGQKYIDGRVVAGVLKRFGSDIEGLLDAVQYARAVMDGCKLFKEGVFKPTMIDEAKLSQEAYARISELVPVLQGVYQD